MLGLFKAKPGAAVRILVLVGLLLFSAVSQAQKRWTLSDCIQYAYQHNLRIRKAGLYQQAAKADKRAAQGAFLPDLSATASDAYGFGTPVNDQTSMREGDVQNINVGLQTSVTLFAGLRNLRSLQRALLDERVQARHTEITRNEVALSIAESYLQVLLSKALVGIDQTQLRIDKDQLSRVDKQVRAGTQARGALYDAQRILAADAQKLTESENAYVLNRLKLAQLLQLDDYEDFRVADVALSLPDEPLSGYDPEEIYRKALLSRPEIEKAQLQIRSAEKGVGIAKAAYMPSLTGALGLSSRDSRRLGATEQSTLGKAGADRDFFERLKDNKTYSASLSLRIPLFNRLQVKRNVERAAIKVREAQLDLQQAQNELRQNIAQAYAQAKASYSAYRAAQKTEKAARTSFAYARDRFAVGAFNSFDFDRAKNNLTQAKTDGVRAKYRFLFRLKVLDFYAGIPLNLP